MGKKRLRAKYTSKGERVGINKTITKAIKRDRSPLEKALLKLNGQIKSGHYRVRKFDMYAGKKPEETSE